MARSAAKVRFTYEDYAQLPDDGKRYEVIDGRIYVSPAPSRRHQTVSKRIGVPPLQPRRGGARPRRGLLRPLRRHHGPRERGPARHHLRLEGQALPLLRERPRRRSRPRHRDPLPFDERARPRREEAGVRRVRRPGTVARGRRCQHDRGLRPGEARLPPPRHPPAVREPPVPRSPRPGAPAGARLPAAGACVSRRERL